MEGNKMFEVFIWFILMFVVMYFFILRPNKVKMTEYKKMLSEIKVGDKIVFSGGIYGTIKSMLENTVIVEISKGVEIEIDKTAISGKA